MDFSVYFQLERNNLENFISLIFLISYKFIRIINLIVTSRDTLLLKISEVHNVFEVSSIMVHGIWVTGPLEQAAAAVSEACRNSKAYIVCGRVLINTKPPSDCQMIACKLDL